MCLSVQEASEILGKDRTDSLVIQATERTNRYIDVLHVLISGNMRTAGNLSAGHPTTFAREKSARRPLLRYFLKREWDLLSGRPASPKPGGASSAAPLSREAVLGWLTGSRLGGNYAGEVGGTGVPVALDLARIGLPASRPISIGEFSPQFLSLLLISSLFNTNRISHLFNNLQVLQVLAHARDNEP